MRSIAFVVGIALRARSAARKQVTGDVVIALGRECDRAGAHDLMLAERSSRFRVRTHGESDSAFTVMRIWQA